MSESGDIECLEPWWTQPSIYSFTKRQSQTICREVILKSGNPSIVMFSFTANFGSRLKEVDRGASCQPSR